MSPNTLESGQINIAECIDVMAHVSLSMALSHVYLLSQNCSLSVSTISPRASHSLGNCPTKVEWKPVSVKICFRVLAKNDNQCNSLEKTKQISAMMKTGKYPRNKQQSLKVMWPLKKDICVFSNSIDRDISQTYTFPISLGLGEARVARTRGYKFQCTGF